MFPQNPVAFLLSLFLNAYLLCILVWVLGSWFPDWRYQNWYRAIGGIVEPYINLFRGLRLQLGMIDISPMVAMMALQLVGGLLISALRNSPLAML